MHVRCAIAVAIVAEHGVTDAGEMAADLMRASRFRRHAEEGMSADHALSDVARSGGARDAGFSERTRDAAALSSDAAHERHVLFFACGEGACELGHVGWCAREQRHTARSDVETVNRYGMLRAAERAHSVEQRAG